MRREVPIVPEHTALLFVDVQNYAAHPDGGEFRDLSPAERARFDYYLNRQRAVALPNMARLQGAFRATGVEILYVVIENLTADGRDRSLDYKISGIDVPKGSWDARVCDAIAPAADEIVLTKTSSNVFVSTSLDHILRNLGTRQLVICGVVTDQCVESAVRNACDLGYLVTLVPDACATYSEERHQASLYAIAGYCRQRDTDRLLQELME